MSMDIEHAASLIAQARSARRRVELPPELQPASAAQAYAIQDAVGARLQLPQLPPAWKVGAANAAAEPSAAPIYELLSSPASVDPGRMSMVAVEAEIAFEFGEALPARERPYADDEVLAAVRALRVAIEVCDSRLAHWERATDLAKLADHQLNFALVAGAAVEARQAPDFRALRVTTRVDGAVAAQGTGCHALDDPRRLLPWLANHARRRGGIGAGCVVTTGAWLGLHRLQAGVTVAVEFDGLGTAQVTFPV